MTPDIKKDTIAAAKYLTALFALTGGWFIACCYVAEVFYAKHFSIPISLITVNYSLIVPGALVGLYLLVYILAAIYTMPTKENKLHEKLFGWFISLSMSVYIILVFFVEFAYSVELVALCLFSILIYIGAVYQQNWIVKKWFNDKISNNDILILSALALTMFMSSAGTVIKAKNKIEYPVANINGEIAILATYGDTVIMAGYDEKTKVLDKKFVIMKISDKPFEYQMKKIGPLINQ